MTNIHAARFLKAFSLTAASLLFVTGAFNYVIDPFSMFGSPAIHGINADKPEFNTHARMAKAHAVHVIKPRGLILGSSRAEYGLDPAHPGWDAQARPVYNLALPSGHIYEAFKYLQHAYAVRPIRQVVLALDLFMFNANWQTESDFNQARLATSGGTTFTAGWMRDIVTALFSVDALRASLATFRSQGDTNYVPYLANGMRHPTRNWRRIQNIGGHHKAFLSNERYSLTAPDGWGLFNLHGPDGESLPTLATFRDLVTFCRSNGIDLRVIISPLHARKLEVIWQLGLWPTYELWKRRLLQALVADAMANTNSTPFPLWDFSGYNDITTESVPSPGDTETQMRWFWEGSHYKKEVGDIMFDKVFHRNNRHQDHFADFGREVALDVIDAHFQSIREARGTFASSYPDQVKEIGDLITATAAERERLRKTSNALLRR